MLPVIEAELEQLYTGSTGHGITPQHTLQVPVGIAALTVMAPLARRRGGDVSAILARDTHDMTCPRGSCSSSSSHTRGLS